MKANGQIKALNANNNIDPGFALHYFGDRYTHSQIGNEDVMYCSPFWAYHRLAPYMNQLINEKQRIS